MTEESVEFTPNINLGKESRWFIPALKYIISVLNDIFSKKTKNNIKLLLLFISSIVNI